MTVASDLNRADLTIASGTTEYPFEFRIFEDSDLAVVRRDDDGVETLLVLNTDYEVTGAGDYSGGMVILDSGYATTYDGEHLTVRRVLDIVQETSIRNQAKFYPETHEDVFDRLVMIDQQQQESIDRAFKLPVTSDGVSAELPTPVAGRSLKWNADADALINSDADPDTIAAAAAASAAAAAESASDAADSLSATDAIYDAFDDRYLGAKAADPILDNDGDALITGALYWNTITSTMLVYNGSAWEDVTATISFTPVQFTGDGTTGPFTLPFAPLSENNVMVSIGGTNQHKSAFDVSGTELTFTSVTPIGVEIEVVLVSLVPVGSADAANVTYTPDGVSAVQTNVETKLREFVSVMDFGAVGDGVTDDGPAFILAAAAGKEVRVPWTSTGYNLGNAVIQVQSGQFIRGENNVLIKSVAGNACFLLQGFDLLSGVSDFRIDMTGAPPGSSAIRFDTTVSPVWRVRLDRLMFQNCYSAIDQTTTGAASYVVDVIVNDIGCIKAKGTQIQFNYSRGFFKWTNVNIDNTVDGASSLLVTWKSAQFTKFAGLELNNFDVTGQTAVLSQVYNANVIGIYIDNTGAPAGFGFVWLNRVRSESSMGIGMLIKGISFLHMCRVDSHAALGDALQIFNCALVTGVDVYARGGKDQAGKSAAQVGVFIDTCTDVVLSSVAADMNDGAGVQISNSQRVSLAGVRSKDNGTYGLRENGTSSDNTITGANFSSNTTAPYSVLTARVIGANASGVRIEDPSTFCAHKNGTDQAGIASATFTLVTFGTALLNKGASYNTAASRWTPPAGSYRISANVICTAGLVAGSEFTILIYKNGSSLCHSTVIPSSAAACTAAIDRVITASGTDYFEVYVYIAGAGTKTIGGAFSQSSFQGTPLN